MPSALAIIRDEHRSLAAVLHGLAFLVAELRAGRGQPDFRLFGAMLRYLQEFPDRLHHPKEDEHLFRALRARDPATAAFLEELEGEHVAGRVRATTLEDALLAYEREGAPAFERFAGAVDAYTAFHWEHMRKEEDVVLPRAIAVLTPEDWAVVDAAFAANADPLSGVGSRRELRELFRRIAAMAPPPIGVGPGGEG